MHHQTYFNTSVYLHGNAVNQYFRVSTSHLLNTATIIVKQHIACCAYLQNKVYIYCMHIYIEKKAHIFLLILYVTHSLARYCYPRDVPSSKVRYASIGQTWSPIPCLIWKASDTPPPCLKYQQVLNNNNTRMFINRSGRQHLYRRPQPSANASKESEPNSCQIGRTYWTHQDYYKIYG